MSEQSEPNWRDIIDAMGERFNRMTANALSELERLLDEARAILRCSEAGILVPPEDDQRAGELRFLVSVNSSPDITEVVLKQRVPCDKSIAGYVFSTAQPVAVTNPGEEDPAKFYRKVDVATGLETHHYLAVPLIDQQTTLGVVTFVNRPGGEPDEPFSAAEIGWAQHISRMVTIGLQYYRRLCIQHEWTKSELDQAVADLEPATPDRGATFEFAFPGSSSRSPLIRSLDRLETLSPEHQELAADLIERLAEHLAVR